MLVSFQPHDPGNYPKQLEFFALASSAQFGFNVRLRRQIDAPRMFPPSSAELSGGAPPGGARAWMRQQAFLYELTRAHAGERTAGSHVASSGLDDPD